MHTQQQSFACAYAQEWDFWVTGYMYFQTDVMVSAWYALHSHTCILADAHILYSLGLL